MKKIGRIACGVLLLCTLAVAHGAQQTKSLRVTIATGGAGGVYYPLGGAIAKVLTAHLPYLEATAEPTAGSADNLKLISTGKAEIAFSMADTAWDAFRGLGSFRENKLPVRAIAVFYPNRMQVVTVEGRGIDKMADLKGKRISTGAPGSGTEIMALRLLEAYEIDPNRDVKRERLSVADSAAALKDRRIDAFVWAGGVPTTAVAELASAAGTQLKLIDHGDAAEKMRAKFGPLYVKNRIAGNAYAGLQRETSNVDVWNLLVVNASADEKVVYDIVKTLFDYKNEIAAVHKDGSSLTLDNQAGGASPIPFHPGAVRYLKEQGLILK